MSHMFTPACASDPLPMDGTSDPTTSSEPAHNRAAIGHRMARGAAWMVLMRLVIRGTGLINMMIMARLLVPEDFGLIAMAMIFVGAIATLSEFSFDVVLITHQRAGRDHYDTAWTLSVIRGVVMAIILIAIAGQAAVFFDEPRLKAMITVLAISSLLLGLENIGVVDFRKSLNFRRDFLFMAGNKLVAVVITVILAFLWRNYWALVGGIIAGNLWRVGASYVMHPYRPGFCLATWRELFALTKWLLLQNVLQFFRNRIDQFVIGKVLGATTLGVYAIAYDLANLVTTELMAPIRRALLPGYAKIIDELDRVRNMFANIFGLTLWLGAPIAIGIGLVADPLVGLLLGDGWQATVPIIQILTIAGFISLLSSGSHPIYLALGRPELQTMLAALSLLLLVPGLIIGTRSFGIFGAAIALVITQTVIAFIDIVLVLRLLQLGPKAIGAVSWRSLSALVVMVIVVHGIMHGWPQERDLAGDAALLSSAVVIGCVTYITTSLVLWRLFGGDSGPERHVLNMITVSLASLRSRVVRPVLHS